MQFIKAQWISLLCGLVSVLGVAAAVFGMRSGGVVESMRKVAASAGEISALRGAAQNEDTINAEKELGERFQQQYEAVVATAESINRRKPLLDGVFPTPPGVASRFQFKQEYRRQLEELPRVLRAGYAPSAQDLLDEMEIVEDLKRRKAELEGESVAAATPAGRPMQASPGVSGTPASPRGPLGPAPGALPQGRGRSAPPSAEPQATPPAGPVGRMGPRSAAPSEAARPSVNLPGGAEGEEIHRRATVKKARAIRVYAAPMESFHISPIYASEDAPSPRDMWYAQVGMWVQQDLVNAIAKVNDEAAAQLSEKEANVTNLPVKRIETIQLQGYVTSSGMVVPFPMYTSASRSVPTIPIAPSFTGRRSDDQFDVVRVAMIVVVDQRDLLRLIDAVTRTNFYQLVGAEYTSVDSSEATGFLYGPAPVVRATLAFEGYMARKIFKALMPEEVQKELGIGSEPKEKPKETKPQAAPRGRGRPGA